jgi:hypothetical protein
MLNARPEGLVIREVERSEKNRYNNGLKEIGRGAYPKEVRVFKAGLDSLLVARIADRSTCGTEVGNE